MSFLPKSDRYAFALECRVAPHDCDAAGRLRLAAALRYAQTISTAHLDALGLCHSRLYSEGIVFVLAAMAVKISRQPQVGDILMLKTCPAPAKGAKMVRETIIQSDSGENLIEVQAAWVIIDPHDRRPQRPSAFLHKLDTLEDWSPSIDPTKIKLPTAGTLVLSQPVLYSHLDINRHMNNTVYADLAMDAIPIEDALTRTPDTLLLRLRHETRAGEVLGISRSSVTGGWLVSAKAGDNPCFEAQICFKD